MMRRLCLLAAATAMVVPLSALAQAPTEKAQAEAADLRPFVAQQVAPTVHLLRTPDDFYAFAIGNVTLIEQRDGFVVIDSGMTAAHGRKVVAYARSLANKPIKAVAISHWHNDHPQGVSAIRDAFPNVRIISTRGTEAALLGPAAFDIGYSPSGNADAAVAARVADEKVPFQKLLDDPATAPDRKERIRKALRQFDDYAKDFQGSYIVPPTETFDHQLVLDDPETPVRLMFLGRANTDGDLIAWLPRQKIVATGDIVVSPWPFGFGSFPAQWIETLGKLKALGFATLIPGHGMPQTDTSYVDKLMTTIAEIRSQVGPLARQGLSLEEVRKKVDFSKVGELFGTTARDKANFQGLFADPMTGSAYKEALGQPIVQGEAPEGYPKPRFTEPPPKSTAKRHDS
jgi:glyoxylase-like metal-dependent hydrolase (beta-lactamase superfamily II)